MPFRRLRKVTRGHRQARSGSGGLEVAGGLLAAALVGFHLVGNLLAFGEAAHAGPLDGRDVHEHVVAAVIRLDEPKTLLLVEPLNSTDSHRIPSPLRAYMSEVHAIVRGHLPTCPTDEI